MTSACKMISIIATVLLLGSCSGKPAQNSESSSKAANSPLMDTAKLKSDLNTIVSNAANMSERKLPDTTALKTSGADVLNTTANVLSDSGIDKMGGDNNDAGVVEAKKMMKKMRDSMGINSSLLDSMRKSSEKLAPQKP